jgi:hypothetical protein
LRVEDVLAVDVADARAADRSEERHARKRQSRRGADECDNVGIILEVMRQHGADHLRLVAEPRREQRADRSVDEPRGQRLLLRWAALAFEEAAGDLSGGECLLLIVDGEREEILARL